MAQNTNGEWEGLIHFVGRLRETSARGIKAALADAPKCRFAMLERLHYAIRTYGQEDSIYVSDLARATKKPMPAVSRGLRLLEQDGMVRRETDPEDRRKTLVRITPEGMESLRSCEDALNGYFARVMARLEPEQLARMKELRDVLIDALEAETAATLQNTEIQKGGADHGEDF